MRDLLAEVYNIKKDGFYHITPDGVHNYERWGFGCLVPIRELRLTDLKDWTIFGMWNSAAEDVTDRILYLVSHAHTLRDGKKMASDHDQVWVYDLRHGEMVTL